METKITDLENSQHEVEIKLTAQDLKAHYEKAYQKASKDIEIKGFRKGKVPMNLIKQHFGRRIEADAVEDIADVEFRRVVQENNIQIIGQPSLMDIQKDGENMVFKIRYETLPDFELGSYRGLTLQKPVRRATDEEVQKEIDNLLLRSAEVRPAEQIVNNMFVAKLKLRELDEATGTPIIGSEARDLDVFLDAPQTDPNLKDLLLNAKVGDTFNYRMEMPEEGHEGHNHAHPVKQLRAEVVEIQEIIPPEFTNEAVEKLTDGALTSTEELREDVVKNIENYFDEESRKSMEDQVVDQVVGAHEFSVPEAMVQEVMKSMTEDFKNRNKDTHGIERLTVKEMEPQLRPMAEKIAKWEMIRHKIIEAEEIEVTDEDLQPIVEYYIQQTQMPEDQIKPILKENPQVINRILSDKVVKTLIDYAIINEVEVAPQPQV
ncbi:MAG: trigger factor [Bacteroidota bacterium]